jgi:hypothetical protein
MHRLLCKRMHMFTYVLMHVCTFTCYSTCMEVAYIYVLVYEDTSTQTLLSATTCEEGSMLPVHVSEEQCSVVSLLAP